MSISYVHLYIQCVHIRNYYGNILIILLFFVHFALIMMLKRYFFSRIKTVSIFRVVLLYLVSWYYCVVPF